MPLLGLLLCVRYMNTRYPSLENPQGDSPILSWRLLLEDFSQANFLAEGGFGSVHKGVLSDGWTVSVKQHKLASSHGDQEFCSGVELLSCAHHQNVVMLIGFCNEDRRRLTRHHRDPLEWSGRQKIAVGTAWGLRYPHEECNGGCIVHLDMKPNNILITDDFELLTRLLPQLVRSSLYTLL
ncbi:hypothetical protein Vadar_034209 [Vaccinium darrowii]|uniref:Uncharacterized protein n=1 Tax=Vaccinium darrowii TaxID=229202 RepID=A0ACB7Y412_9ERIC|nr:hypothetical protein Vadar_034209 [Vaccinium darrowii]